MGMPPFANLQKIRNGRRLYSITPRIPGGFVSLQVMERMIAVARKYNCSMKITSGQRIMLIGLTEEQVPQAWEDLKIEPAVRSHYSVKNVEMCPGEICKRSRQKSIGLGMRLEKRFYGVPAPNRTKIGVVACLNGCTSVNSKDIGVLANEAGYIVVAGGSAGYHPRLPDRVAENLTEEEAFRMVEAVFDFYCRTSPQGEKLGDMIDRIGKDCFTGGVMDLFRRNPSDASEN